MLSEGARHMVVMLDNTIAVGMILADHSNRIQLLTDDDLLRTIPWTAIKQVIDEGGVFSDGDDGGPGDLPTDFGDDDPPPGATYTPRRWIADV